MFILGQNKFLPFGGRPIGNRFGGRPIGNRFGGRPIGNRLATEEFNEWTDITGIRP